jgi:ankyrin repeat protein
MLSLFLYTMESLFLQEEYIKFLSEKLYIICYKGVSEQLEIFLKGIKNTNFSYFIDVPINKKENALYICTEQGNPKCVRILLEHGANPNIHGENLVPLQVAIKNSYVDITKLLIKYGADTNIKDKKDKLCSLGCTIRCSIEYHSEIMESLLKNGANPNNLYANNNSILSYYCNEYSDKYIDSIKLLLQYGANVNQKNKEGSTSIMFASVKGNTKCIDTLLKYGANLYIIDKKNNNAFRLSANNQTKDKLLKIFRNDLLKINFPVHDDIIDIIVKMTY